MSARGDNTRQKHISSLWQVEIAGDDQARPALEQHLLDPVCFALDRTGNPCLQWTLLRKWPETVTDPPADIAKVGQRVVLCLHRHLLRDVDTLDLTDPIDIVFLKHPWEAIERRQYTVVNLDPLVGLGKCAGKSRRGECQTGDAGSEQADKLTAIEPTTRQVAVRDELQSLISLQIERWLRFGNTLSPTSSRVNVATFDSTMNPCVW